MLTLLVCLVVIFLVIPQVLKLIGFAVFVWWLRGKHTPRFMRLT